VRSSDLGFEGAGSSPERDRPGEGLSLGGGHDSPCGGLKELIKRITEIQQLSEADRNGIFFALDGLLRDAKARKAYA